MQGLQVIWHCLWRTFSGPPYHQSATWADCDANFVITSGHFCAGCGYHGSGPPPKNWKGT